MDSGVAHNAFFAHLFPASFKLRLDKADGLSPLSQQGGKYRENESQRNKREIRNRNIQRTGEMFGPQMTRVCALHDRNAFVLSQTPVELTVPHVDGPDVTRAMLEQTVGEAAGRGADINTV